MEAFVPELNRLSVKIRNKEMVSVSQWYEMLINEYVNGHKGILTEYIPPQKETHGKHGLIARCFQDFDAGRGRSD